MVWLVVDEEKSCQRNSKKKKETKVQGKKLAHLQ